MQLGNRRVNAVFEETLSPHQDLQLRPSAPGGGASGAMGVAIDRSRLEHWIRMKYEQRAFVAGATQGGGAGVVAAAADGDAPALLRALVREAPNRHARV